jgi:hypothetical protein
LGECKGCSNAECDCQRGVKFSIHLSRIGVFKR